MIVNDPELAPSREEPGRLSKYAGGETRMVKRTYYFDVKGGMPTRNRKGIEFSTAAAAIEHSKELARRLGSEPRRRDPNLSIVVIEEAGAEIHRERVYPDGANRRTSPDNNG